MNFQGRCTLRGKLLRQGRIRLDINTRLLNGEYPVKFFYEETSPLIFR